MTIQIWICLGILLLESISTPFSIFFVKAEDEDNVKDEDANCEIWARRGDCYDSETKEMMRIKCGASCRAQDQARRVDIRKFTEEDSPFFELEAHDRNGKTVHFERFEGYVTVVATVPRLCDDDKAEQLYQELETVRARYPYGCEIVVFPLATNSTHQSECAPHKAADAKQGRSILIMEEVKWDGLANHAVIQFFKKTFSLGGLDEHNPTYFLITSSGRHLEIHERSRIDQIAKHISLHHDSEL